MDWVLCSPQIHSTFSNLGFVQADGYHVSENCNSALESILYNILTEDKYLRSYRRNVSFGQNIQKDLVPLLIHAKEHKTIELVVKILVNLTIPIECLLNLEQISKSDFGRHTIFEIKHLLAGAKVAFTELRASKALVEFLKKNVENEQNRKLSEDKRTNVINCLLLLRNILHIPEESCQPPPAAAPHNGSVHALQNQILWNLFSQGFDKVIIRSMTIPDASCWGVTMIQLVALLYKDQHVVTLNKLLNIWLDASLSDSSEENESNTTPQDRVGSDNSCPILTSEQTSDSSDTRTGDRCGGNDGVTRREVRPQDFNANDYNINDNQPSTEYYDENINDYRPPTQKSIHNDDNGKDNRQTLKCIEQNSNTDNVTHKHKNDISPTDMISVNNQESQNQKKVCVSETSDCGYGTQIENQESISTSSNEDDMPTKKPVHQKPHNIKQKPNTKSRLALPIHDRRRKKIVKRGKANIINIQGLSHKTPTDNDISDVLKEFTVDFLLKGYNSLVHTLHNEILTDLQLKIDTSHFFWLVTYFLKFATQIELDLEHVCSVLSFDMVSYLTSQGVQLCEQFELAVKLENNDLRPTMTRLHLVVTAIREFVQAIELYKKITVSSESDQEFLKKLQIKMCEAEELRSMLVLLLRHYNPKYQSKQYLQDLIVTNHILLMFLDNVMKFPDYNCSTKMVDHLRQFATPEVMGQYGLLLEDYLANGEFVNDCIFTVMHHVGGELGCLDTLFQPIILKAFTTIWKSEFELCDDWTDLIEYFINTYVKKINPCAHAALLCLELEAVEGKKTSQSKSKSKDIHAAAAAGASSGTSKPDESNANKTATERWTEIEISALSWNYLQCSTHKDVVGQITKQLSEDGINKTRDSVIRELLRQNLITQESYEKRLEDETERNTKKLKLSTERLDEEIRKYCGHLSQDSKSYGLEWVQKVLLEICFTKIQLEKTRLKKVAINESKLLNFELFLMKSEELPVISPVAYHALLLNESVPLVPWNCQQATICKDLKFLQLVHKLGFHMPLDSGRLFIRVPHYWTPDYLFDVAGKIRPIDKSKLKFSLGELSGCDFYKNQQENAVPASDLMESPLVENVYQIHKQSHATMVNYTPMPGPSYIPEENPEQLNWLDVVKKSHETKVTLNLESITETAEDILVQSPAATDAAKALLGGISDSASKPAIVITNKKTEIYNGQVKPDYYDNCDDTASVASDLTRMYVSEDDEKLIQPIVVDISTILEEQPLRNKVKKSSKRRREI